MADISINVAKSVPLPNLANPKLWSVSNGEKIWSCGFVSWGDATERGWHLCDYQMAFAWHRFMSLHLASDCRNPVTFLFTLKPQNYPFHFHIFLGGLLPHHHTPLFNSCCFACARFLIILMQTAVGRCRWPSTGLHIASLLSIAAVKWLALLMSPSFSSQIPPTGFITWSYRDMKLK